MRKVNSMGGATLRPHENRKLTIEILFSHVCKGQHGQEKLGFFLSNFLNCVDYLCNQANSE